MTRRTHEPPTFHLFRCPYCESTHFEHERSAESFAGFVAKHLSRCGKPQELRTVTRQDALRRIVTRERQIDTSPDWIARRGPHGAFT